ncbi:MAG: DEAD/DEAH box helicase [Deltaproteobacteria bacterium]|nr:MAG: DEAD/DEAH box helicase [Deltaproteobacteria bacterium]TMB33199.1 MAG: DEAD/DEAH box helicase [Deltaproteobacteria bacterium]
MTFAALGLSKKCLVALEREGFEAPTPIQAQAIPPALQGKDVVGSAATGTGKTLAFVLPILERLEGKHGTRALVLAPTRELALQIHEQVERFRHGHHLRSAAVIGGVGMAPQRQAFAKGVEIVVATPGRLNDHLDSGTARLDQIEILVLDEADRMLDMGFLPQLRRILKHVPPKRQSLLFSATMAGEVADFAREHLREPVRVEVARIGTTSQRAYQQVFLVGQEEKTALLLALLEQDQLSTLVFTRTKRRADRVARSLLRAGHKVAVIHADRSQGQRRAALEGFRSGEHRVLVATDIAARGIDVAEIGHVVNFDMPHIPEDYVHRIGRTARMEASGRASSFASPEEHDLLRGIEKFTRKTVERAAVPREHDAFRDELKRRAEMPPPRREVQRHQRRDGRPHQASGRAHAPRHRTEAAAQPPQKLGSWKPRRRR